ncbi:MAG: hypothetical protein ACUZ8O_09290 [Candidatus Anammoxibacter sp.]
MKTNYLTTKEGARLFLALAEADQKSALECLKRTIGTWDKKKLLQFTTGRRETIWALEKIVIWKNLFSDAARLLLILGEAENETCSNNASGIFADLFTWISSTGASSEERFLILKEALNSTSVEQVLLALRACDRALETGSIVRTVTAGYQGLKKEPPPWKPETWKELYDSFSLVWQLVYNKLDNFTEDERPQAVNILLKHARGLGKIQNLSNMVIDTLCELAKKNYVNKEEILAKVIRILHYDGKLLSSETRHRWEVLKDNLTGSGFVSLLKRYVGMDLLEDKFNEKGNRRDQTHPCIGKLAQQSVENKNLLQPELEWIVTSEAKNGFSFGYELGKRDIGFLLMPILLDVQQKAGDNARVYFLGGYFRALFENDKQRWEKQLDDFVNNKKLNLWIPELTWRSGMSDQAAWRILKLAKEGIIGVRHLKIFGLGSVMGNLAEDVFKEWIKFLLDSSDTSAISIALDLYCFYYTRKESKHTLPEELTFQLLTHELLFQKSARSSHNQMADYDWTEIGNVFVKFYPVRSIELADKMLKHFGEDGTFLEGFSTETQTVLNKITRLFPKNVWKKITKYLGPPIDSRAYHIKSWLRGVSFSEKKHKGILPIIPLEEIWKWVDVNIENRASYLASFVPKILHREEGEICLAREVLIRYGEQEDVRGNLIMNFSSGGWDGPASLHLQGKKQPLLDLKKDEDNKNVKLWIDEYIFSIDKDIEQAKIEEERRGF